MRSETKFFTGVTLITLTIFLFSATSAPGLTISEEKELGDEFLKHARQAYHFVQDPFVEDYLNKIGRKIVAAFPEQPFDFHFYIIENPVYNAFAAPAGHVFLNSGLIRDMDSEEELAGILAHEIAHVYCRHLSERIEKSKKLSLATLAGITAGIFLGSGALAIGAAAAGQAAGLAYSRQDERQADQIGVQYLTAANYSARGLLSMLKKIKARQWFSEQEIPTYLTTHPGTDERIVYIDTLLASDRYRPHRSQTEKKSDDFAMANTIITATCDDVDTALKMMKSRLDRNDEDALAHFGYALALSKNARHEEAIAHLKKAMDKSPDNPQILSALGIEYVLTGDYQNALVLFEKSPATHFLDFKKQLYRAQAEEQAGHLDKSITILTSLVEGAPEFTVAVHALGMTYGRNDNPEQAHYYLGLYFFKIDDHKNALFHLQKARTLTEDLKRIDEIDEMLKKMRAKAHRFSGVNNINMLPAF